MNKQIRKKINFYHTPLFLAKQLYNSIQNKNDQIVKNINDALIALKIYYYQKSSWTWKCK